MVIAMRGAGPIRVLLEQRSVRASLPVAGVAGLAYSSNRVPARSVGGVGPWDARVCGMGGWQFPFQHHLELGTNTLYLAQGYAIGVAPERVGDQWVVDLPQFRERHTYDVHGRLVSVHNRLSNVARVRVGYDQGRLVEIAGRAGRIARFEWNGAGEVTVSSADGATSVLRFDEHSWLTRIDRPNGRCATIQHDDWGRLLEVSDFAGRTTSVTYGPGGTVERLDDDVLGRRDLVVQDHEGSTRYSLVGADEESTVVVSVADDGTQVRVRRCCGSPAEVTTQTAPDGSTVIRLADGTSIEQRQVRAPSALWGTPTGPLVQERLLVTPAGERRVTRRWTESSPDGPREVFEVDGRRSEQWYDAASRTVHGQSPAGRLTRVRLDELGRPEAICTPDRPPVSLVYGESGLVTSTTMGSVEAELGESPDGAAIVSIGDRIYGVEVDAATGLVTNIGPDGRRSGIRVGSDDALAAEVDGYSVLRIRSVGDDALPSTSITFPEIDGATDEVVFDRDRRGRLTRLVEPHGTTTIHRDSVGAIERIETSTGTVTVGRDRAGRVDALVTDWGEATRIERDGPRIMAEVAEGRAPGRVERLWDGHQPSGYRTGGVEVAVARDADSLTTRVGPVHLVRDAASGLVVERRSGRVVERIGRDDDLRISSVEAMLDDGTVVARFVSRFDRNGQREQRTESIGSVDRTTEYRYDDAGRLAGMLVGGELVWRAEHDGRGNRVRLWRGDEYIGSEYDDRDRLVQQGATTFAYDATDRMVAARTTDALVRYGYDGRGHLVSVDHPEGQVQYVVDGAGRRVARYLDGAQTNGYLWMGRRLVAVLDPGGTATTVFVYGDGRVPTGAAHQGRWLHLIVDHVGSVRGAVDITSGELVGWTDLDPDGRVVDGLDAGLALGFGGGLVEPLTGQVQFGHRVYDPHLARWTRRDPLLIASGRTNFHEYCSGDPVNRIDPSGLTDTGPVHPKAPSSGVGMCVNDWGPFDHASVSVDGKVYGWNPTADNLANWKDQTAEKLGDKSFECEEVPDVDPECVMNKIMESDGSFKNATPDYFKHPLTDYNYLPPVNTCWNPVYDAIADCGGNPYEHTPTDDSGTYEKIMREQVYPALDIVNEALEAANPANWFD